MIEVLKGPDWIALVGIVGALSGVIVGSFFTYKLQARQQAHEDSTRFHDLRMAKYAEFTALANQAVSYFVIGQYDFDSSMEFQKAFNTVRLVASMPVLETANKINISFGVMQNLAIAKTKVTQQHSDVFNDAVQQFIAAARIELKT